MSTIGPLLSRGRIDVRQKCTDDQTWIEQTLRERWGNVKVVSNGVVHDGGAIEALVAVIEGRRSGLLTYQAAVRDCEVVSLDAIEQWGGIGTALLEAMAAIGRQRGWRRLHLVTTNDNIDALRFYQRRAWKISAINVDAIAQARLLKPSIPLTGSYDIPIRDEIELEYVLS
ncbi:MAG: GNAT family N-acetyltransferase [Rhizomicrobium sp.]